MTVSSRRVIHFNYRAVLVEPPLETKLMNEPISEPSRLTGGKGILRLNKGNIIQATRLPTVPTQSMDVGADSLRQDLWGVPVFGLIKGLPGAGDSIMMRPLSEHVDSREFTLQTKPWRKPRLPRQKSVLDETLHLSRITKYP